MIKELTKANIERQKEWCNNGPTPDLSFRGNELAGETGEACNIIKKLERERHGWRGTRATKEMLAKEIADIVICCSLVSIEVGFDLEDAVKDKFNETSDKYNLHVKL